jgi:hypothetical protein
VRLAAFGEVRPNGRGVSWMRHSIAAMVRAMTISEADQALLDRADRYIANPGGGREKRRLNRAIDDRIATLVAELDQLRERQFEILFENGIVDKQGRRIDDEPPAA